MNRKKIKKIRKKARGILVEWLQSLVEGEEKKKIFLIRYKKKKNY